MSLLEKLDETLNSRESILSFSEFDFTDDQRKSIRQSVQQMDINQFDEIKKMYSQLANLKEELDENEKEEAQKKEKQDELKEKITRLIKEAEELNKEDVVPEKILGDLEEDKAANEESAVDQ